MLLAGSSPLLNLQEERIGPLHLQLKYGPQNVQRGIEGIVCHLKWRRDYLKVFQHTADRLNSKGIK